MKKIYYIIIIIIVSIISFKYYDLRINKYEYYLEKYQNITTKIVYGNTAPRGRILDRNGKVLVDNIGSHTVFYHNIANLDTYDIATKLNNILISKNEPSILELKQYYIKNNNTDYLITDEEYKLLKLRKISLKEFEDLKISRIDKEIDNYTTEEKNIIYLYNLLNSGYSYDKKIIKKDISVKECALINEANIPGLTCEDTVKRIYLYDTLNDIYGTIGSLTEEDKDYYLSQGYSLNDDVGLSYLEKQYDNYLKGEKAIYKVNYDNTLTLIKEAKQGNDIILSIDIDLQLKINEIIKKHIDTANNYKNTKYFNSTYVIVSNPNTGEIIASTGLSKVKDNYYDITRDILTNSFTVGSVVKGASMTVGYQNNLIEVGKKINDSCVKLYQVPEKCSYRRWGLVDDITALKTSSNYYQFLLAIKLTGHEYNYNMSINATKNHFDIYRNTFASFGLGSSTGIDLEKEFLGIKGKKIADDLLLNFSIGQYDTYTPLQLSNYINTIATSGKRYALHYLKNVQNNNEIIYEYNPILLNTVESNFDRIKEGFRQVLSEGTGRGYTKSTYNPAGKTGTAEIVYDKDTMTVNQSFIMFAPLDNPEYSIVVVSPNTAYNDGTNNYISPINRLISLEISNLIFEK